MRSYFFGKSGDTSWNKKRLLKAYKTYTHHSFDIRNEKKVSDVCKENRFSLVVHTAAQPSHDWAAREPLTDFSVNATATMVLLEAVRQHAKDAVFIFTSTNKVYGDNPNLLPLIEQKTRYDLPLYHPLFEGIDESMSLDQTTHSIFGVSKTAADLMVQEYGRYFGLQTTVFRGGCLTGPAHAAVSLHGFLAYLMKCAREQLPYTIIGYKGKQVRDNIHVHDLVRAIDAVYQKPRQGEVYNIGGGRRSHVSLLEAIGKIENILGKKIPTKRVHNARIGDHKWYVSDMSKFRSHYPAWSLEYDTDRILLDLAKRL